MRRAFLPRLFVLAVFSVLAVTAVAQEPALTVEALEQQGYAGLDSAALEKLVVGRALNIRGLADDTFYEMVFFGDGYRLLRNPKKSSGETAGREGIATYEVTAGRLVTRFGGSIFDVRVYEAGGRYLAADEKDGGVVTWEVFTREGDPPQPSLTINALALAGIMPLDDEALRRLVVGRAIALRRRDTGRRYRVLFRSDGKREITNAKTSADGVPLAYEIANGWINTQLEGQDYRVRVYRVGDGYLAAHSGDGGAVNWEILATR